MYIVVIRKAKLIFLRRINIYTTLKNPKYAYQNFCGVRQIYVRVLLQGKLPRSKLRQICTRDASGFISLGATK